MIPLQGSGFGLGSVRVPGVQGRSRGRPIRLRLGRRVAGILRHDRHADRRGPRVPRFRLASARRGSRSSARRFVKQAWPGQSGDRPHRSCSETDDDRGTPGPDRRRRARREVPLHQLGDRAVHLRADGAAADPRHGVLHPARARARKSRRRSARRWRRSNRTCRSSCCNRSTMRRALGLLPQKLAAWIAGSVGTIGIFLAALGLYGLMAFLVAQRTQRDRDPHGARRVATRHAHDGAATGRRCSARSAG